jgi:hypothetical protein
MVLLNGPSLWFYDPASKASVRLSPQQRLIGQASVADVLTVNLARDYASKVVAEEALQDADRKERQCWHVDMNAATADALYSRIEIWIERGTYRSVKAKFYSDSGRLLKITASTSSSSAPFVQRKRSSSTRLIPIWSPLARVRTIAPSRSPTRGSSAISCRGSSWIEFVSKSCRPAHMQALSFSPRSSAQQLR